MRRGTGFEVISFMALKVYGILLAFLSGLLAGGLPSARAEASVFLSVESLNFISPDYENTPAQISFVGLDIKTSSQTRKSSFFNIDLEARYAAGKPVLSYVNLSEMYLVQQNESFNIYYGRLKYRWSALDELWNLGFFQPQFRWNSLDANSQGNVGIFFESSVNFDKNFSWMVYASPLYLPDQGPGYDMKDGEFTDSNPWFNPPPRHIDFSGQVLPVDYSLITPKNEDVVLRANYGLQLGYRSQEGYFIRSSYLATPSHQVALTYKATLVADRVRVQVVPQVYQEQNVSLDLGYDSSGWRAGLFALYNDPQTVDHQDGFNYPELSPSVSWGPHVQAHFEGAYGSLKLHASGIWLSGGEVTEQGPDAGQIHTSLTGKHPYQSAYKLGAHYKTFVTTSVLYSCKLEWTEGFKNTIKFLKFNNMFEMGKWWSFYLDLLLIETPDYLQEPDSQVGYLRSLDQIVAGVRYEF